MDIELPLPTRTLSDSVYGMDFVTLLYKLDIVLTIIAHDP